MLQRTFALAAAIALAGALGAAPARAQDWTDDAPGLAEVAPFVMPDTSERTSAGVDVFVGVIDADEGGVLFTARARVLTFEPYLDFAVTPELKLWGRLPIAYADAEGTLLGVEQDETDTLLGNAGLGARFMTQVSYELRAGGGVSVHLPTADAGEAGNLLEGTAIDVPLAVSIVRFFQGERYLVDTTTLSGHGDLRFEKGRGYLQGQIAYLHLLAEDDDVEDADLLRLGLAGGYWISPTVAAVAELTTLSTILDDDVQFNAEDEDEDFFHSFDLGLRFSQPRGSLSLRFHLPLDDVFRDSDLLGGAADLTLYF